MMSNLFPLQSTPVPNHLLDVEMPRLSDTEWRILCVLVRQTLGWRGEVEGNRKLRDWMTHSQLKKRTGRESAAVSRAIQTLLTKQLIVVEDSEGRELRTPQQRQHQLGRLYFRLHPRLLPQTDSRANVPQTFSYFESADARMERKVAKSENTKAKTTKETVYKTTPPTPSTMPQPRMEVAAKQFMHRYQKLFQQCSPQSLPSPFSEDKEGKLIRQLLEQYTLQTLCDLLEIFFALEDKWVREQGYSLVAFRHRLPKLLMRPQQMDAPMTKVTAHWSKVETLFPPANYSKTWRKGDV